MSESNEQKIARLMAAGLDHYGNDNVEEAVACWQEVLTLSPSHQVALDYLEAAGFVPGGERPQAEPEPDVAAGDSAMMMTAWSHIENGEWSEALDVLEIRTRKEPRDLEAQAALDLLRSHLHTVHRQRIGSGSGIATVKLGPDEILRFNLPANAGFVLSMIDGHTSVSDLVALTGMDPFDALQVFTRLLDAGIVEVRA